MALLGGCEVLLKFDEAPVPIDAPIDAQFAQAECDYLEPNDSLETAAAITATDVGPAAICVTDATTTTGGDTDFYKFTVPAGTTRVDVKISFTNRPSGDLDLRLLDAAGVMKARSSGFGDGEEIVCPALSPQCDALPAGDYVFQVYPALPGSVNRYDIALTLQ